MDDECSGEDGRDQCEKEQPEEPEETKKQTAVSRWSAEASCELLSAMALLTAENNWQRQLLENLGVSFTTLTPLLYTTCAITIAHQAYWCR
jgi:hypothetical protein